MPPYAKSCNGIEVRSRVASYRIVIPLLNESGRLVFETVLLLISA